MAPQAWAGLEMFLKTMTFMVSTKPFHLGSAFLMSLFLVDQVAWGVSKMVQYDALEVSKCLGYSYIMIDAFMNAGETVIELVATSAMPRIFAATNPEGTPIESRNLTVFAIKALMVSNAIAVIALPPLSYSTWVNKTFTDGALACYLILRGFQYNFLNQIGDAAVELSRPHWLRTFTASGANFVVTPLCCLSAKVSPSTLSASTNLSRYLWLFPVVIPYLLFRKDEMIRFVLGVLFALLGFVCATVMLLNKTILTEQIVSEVASDEDVKKLSSESALAFSSLRPCEKMIIQSDVVVNALCEIALNAFQAVIIIELPSISTPFAAVVPISVIIYCAYKMKRDGKLSEGSALHIDDLSKGFHGDSAESNIREASDLTPYSERLAGWRNTTISMSICMTGGSFCFGVLGGTAGALLACLFIIPVYALKIKFKVGMEAFYTEHEVNNVQQVTAMMFWAQILKALLQVPLVTIVLWLYSNYGGDEGEIEVPEICGGVADSGNDLSQNDSSLEKRQTSVLLAVSVPILVIQAILITHLGSTKPVEGGTISQRYSMHPDALVLK